MASLLLKLKKSKFLEPEFILKISCFFILIARGYQHIFKGTPYTAYIWDYDYFSWFVKGVLNKTWCEYTRDRSVHANVAIFSKALGFVFIFLSILILKIKKKSFLHLLATLLLGIYFIHNYKDKMGHVAQILEHTIQCFTPLLLYFYYSRPYKFVLNFAKVLVATTFLGHGLYVVGAYPMPGHFIDMTISILNCSENFARNFLLLAGILDIVIVIGIYISKIQRYVLYYAVFWGAATACARILANLNFTYFASMLKVWGDEFVYRIPHALIPLFILVFLGIDQYNKKEKL